MLDLIKLNLYASRILSGNILETYKPFTGDLDGSIQILPKSQDVYYLNSPISGSVKDVKNVVRNKDDSAILRLPISYTLALKMQENENLFNYEMLNFTNLALGSLTRVYGDLTGKTVVCCTPGTTGSFFRELENIAAIEMRYYVK